MKKNIGKLIHKLASKLWPLNRSLTGDGVRETLNIIKKELPQLKIKEIPSQKKVFDWKIPLEWKVNKAYIIDPDGNKICDFKKNNLHLMGYSIPVEKKIKLSTLQKNLYSLPDQPSAIPYITSYYKKNWGFCLTHHQRKKLKNGQYKVVIDCEHFKGNMSYGELIIKGKSTKEVFFSTYVCHPSMANNELSGPTISAYLAKFIKRKKRKYTYRFIFVPETIGAISYLFYNKDTLKKKVIAGYNLTCLGDNRSFSYLPSRSGNTLSDFIAKYILNENKIVFKKYNWNDRGSDERQYCAPGIDLPIASVMRTKYGKYKEYHTSLDDLKKVVTSKGLGKSYEIYVKIINLIEKSRFPKTKVFCEPQLGKRGLYPTVTRKKADIKARTLINLISYCDGKHSFEEISKKCLISISEVNKIVLKLKKKKLISIFDFPEI